MVDTAPPYAATQDAIAAAQAREAAGAAQAAAINAAYMNNTLPVLPKYAAGGGATYTAAELADAASEQAKHEAAFHPTPINYAAYANVPLSQMPANVASRVQEYYTQNPSARAQAITQQYAVQHQIAENPYNPDTAAGIAWEVQRTTGGSGRLTESLIQEAASPVDKFGQPKSSYVPYGASAVSGISTVPTRDVTSGMLSGSKMVAALPSGTTTTYMPYGEFAQIEMKGSKLLLDERTGELGVYQQPFGHSSFMLTGGGGRAALQSGMFTVEKAETPYVVEQGNVGTYVLPSGKGLSRLGSEAYGGLVRPLDDRTLSPNEAISRYSGTTGKYNLANLVSQIPAGKAEVPGAKIPWSISEYSPAIQYMDKGGIVPGSAITVPSGGRLVGGKTVAGVATVTEDSGVGALPTPFLSLPQKTTVEQPTGEIFGVNVPVASQILSFFQPGKEVTKSESSRNIPEVTTLEKQTATPIEGGILYTDYYKTTGGKVTTETTTEKAIPSGFDVWLSGAEKTTAEITGISKLPTPTMEQIKEMGKNPLFMTTNPLAANLLQIPQTKEYAASFIRGEATQIKEKPLESAISYGVGYTMGAGWKGLEAVVGAGRAGAAEQIISKGGVWRAADIFAGGVMKYAPVAMGATYAADVTSRVTKGGTDFTPAAAERLGGIAIGEAIPMGVGFGRGYEAPVKAYTAAREAQIGYRQAQVEIAGERTTLLQKPTAPGEVGFKDVATYVYGPKVSAAKLQAADILSGRTGEVTLGRSVELGARPTERLAAAKQAAMQAVITAKVLAKPTAEAALGRASIEVARYRYAENQPIAEAVYGKYFEAKTKLPVKAEQALVSAETSLWTLAQKAKTPGITVKSAIQERGGLGIDTTMIKRPSEEITRLNVLYEAGKKISVGEPAATPSATGAPTSGKFRKTIVGGRERTGLAKEPSLKSTGVSEKAAGGVVSKTGTRVDYRGKLASEKMKPMGERAKGTKQSASAMQIMSEKLAMPEGMTRGKVAPMPQRSGLVGFPQIQIGVPRTGVVQVVEPTTEVTQKQRMVMAQQQEVVPSLMGATVTAQRTAQEVTQKQRQALAVTQMVDITSGIDQKERIKQAQTEYSRQMQSELQGVSTGSKSRQDQTSRQNQRVDIVTTPATKTSQRQETVTTEVPRTRITTVPGPTTGIGFPTLGGGGGAGGGYKKGSRAYVEVLGFETSRGRKGAWTFGKRKAKK